MKNIVASVGVFPTQEKKEAEVEKIVEEEVGGKIEEEEEVEEEYHQMENEVIFCL